LRLDNQSMMASLNALNTELNELKAKFSSSEANNFSLLAQVDKLSEENRIFRDQLANTSDDLAETEQRNRQLETELGLSFTPETPTPEAIPLEIIEPETTPVEAPASEPEETTPASVVIEIPESETIVTVEANQPVKVTVAENPAPTPEEKPQEETPPPAPEVVAPAPEEISPAVGIPAAADAKDDLTVIEGIGPKIQELLYQYGIRTYNQLSDTDVTKLKEILAAAGSQLAMHDPGTWPSQANLAANDQWEALKSIQGFLKGGKKPT